DVPKWVGGSLSTPVVRAVFLTAQEALANVARHAKATEVTVRARRVSKGVELCIVDNGKGFDPSSIDHTVGHGLANMRARAEELSGSYEIESFPGNGTKITLVFPSSKARPM
ncbi:MAG: ATP-binding protein, partial [Anaerolineae bacterium]|nr:ATP-binding protein [Anaerolineae bacterium]